MKNASSKAASLMTKESGKSEGKIGDYRQAVALLKEQHMKSSKVNPSILLALVYELRAKKKLLKAKKKNKKK